jgi:hypothetical protein
MFFYNYNKFTFNLLLHKIQFIKNFVNKLPFLLKFYSISDLIWQEGLLIDFTQKKIIDNWVKKFLIYSAYIFNERLVFDKIVRFYLDLLVWPLHHISIFETNNTANMLFFTFFFFLILYFSLFFLYFFLIVLIRWVN